MIANSIDDLIGNTPLVKINTLSNETGTTILGKCEFMNPTSSVKDRIAFNMINEAMKSGVIDKNSVIIEPTSGNTGIGLAAICASRGLRLILTMPESMSIERRKLLTYLGAELVLTPASQGMNGAIEKADVLATEIDKAIVLQQFKNPNNPDIHRKTTALEILKDTNNTVDIFVAAVGTGGTLMGLVCGLEPAEALVIGNALTAIFVRTGVSVDAGTIKRFIDEYISYVVQDRTEFKL